MPKRFFKYSRTEPARTIIFVVGLLTALMQSVAIVFEVMLYGFDIAGIAVESLIIIVPGILATKNAYLNDVSGMSRWSFWLFAVWLLSALLRLAFTPDWMMLLWAPMLTLALIMAICHIHMHYMVRHGIPPVGYINQDGDSL